MKKVFNMKKFDEVKDLETGVFYYLFQITPDWVDIGKFLYQTETEIVFEPIFLEGSAVELRGKDGLVTVDKGLFLGDTVSAIPDYYERV